MTDVCQTHLENYTGSEAWEFTLFKNDQEHRAGPVILMHTYDGHNVRSMQIQLLVQRQPWLTLNSGWLWRGGKGSSLDKGA